MEYGVSYFGNRMLEHVRQDMQKLSQMGFNTIVHTFSEADLEFSEKAMAKIFDATKREGLTVWADPWGVGGIFGGEAYSGFLQRHPEVWQVTNEGQIVGSACFHSKQFQDFIKTWIDAVIHAGADAIFWDEPHFHLFQPYDRFPKEWTCRCQVCQAMFKDQFGYVMPEEFISDIARFRNDTAIRFFTEMTAYAKQKTVDNVLCFLPFESEMIGITDYESIAKLETIQNIGSDPYWMAFNKPMEPFLTDVTQKVLGLAHQYQKRHHMWLQAFMVPSGKEGELVEGAQIIKDLGADSIFFWGVDACAHISKIAPDEPEKVWNTVQHIIKTIS